MKITNLILFICIVFICSCNEPEDFSPIIPTTENSSLEISVFECLSDGCFDKQLIPGAKVVLYSSEEDQDNRNAIFSSTTSIDGKVSMQVNVFCVYITVQYNQELQMFKENTPPNTHSLVEVLF